jgi:hypothetical protein
MNGAAGKYHGSPAPSWHLLFDDEEVPVLVVLGLTPRPDGGAVDRLFSIAPVVGYWRSARPVGTHVSISVALANVLASAIASMPKKNRPWPSTNYLGRSSRPAVPSSDHDHAISSRRKAGDPRCQAPLLC